MANAQPKQMPKKLVFASEWMKDRNATQAAVRAGYSARTAHSAGPRLLDDVEVQAFIRSRTEAIVEKNEINVGRVLKEVETGAYLDPKTVFAEDGTVLPIDQIPEATRRAISGFEVVETFVWEGEGPNRRKVWNGYIKKIKFVGKTDMLTLAARHLGMLHDKVDVKIDNIAELISAAEQRAKGVK